MSRVQDTFEDRWSRRFLLVFSALLSVIPPWILGLGFEQTIVVLLLFVLLYLEALESVTLRVEDQLNRPAIVPSYSTLEDRIKDRIEEQNPDQIHLLDYSGMYAQSIFEAVSDTDIEIYR